MNAESGPWIGFDVAIGVGAVNVPGAKDDTASGAGDAVASIAGDDAVSAPGDDAAACGASALAACDGTVGSKPVGMPLDAAAQENSGDTREIIVATMMMEDR